MKFFIFILFLVIFFLLTSCGKGDLVDKNFKNYRYSRDKTKIWYKKVNAPDVSGLWDYDWLEVPADASSFVLMKYGIGKDKNHIFQTVNIISNVDYETFTVDEAGFFRDKNHIYLNQNAVDGKLKILEDANPATYQIVKLGAVYYSENPQYNWAKDDQHYFHKNKTVPVDYDSFVILTSNIFADKDTIYSNNNGKFHSYLNKNGTSKNFAVLDGDIIHSSKYFYFRDFFANGQLSEIEIEDSNSIKMFSKRDYFAIDGVVYFRTIPIENADLESFETFEKGDAVWFAKDKNHVYVNSNIVADADPKTVIYNPIEKRLEDRDFMWKWSETKSKTLNKIKKEKSQ